MAIAVANGITIAYEISGKGTPLTVIAGLGYSRWMWHKMLPGLAENFQVLSYDNRGVGESDKPAGPYNAQLLADDLVGLLQVLGIEQTAVFGHSMGGFVAQAFALAYPEKVSHLILSATNFGGPNHVPVTPEAMAVLTDTSSDPLTRLRNGILVSCANGFAERQPAIIEEWLNYRAAHPIDPAGYQAQMGVGLSLISEEACFEHKLSAISAPTLILSGAEDKVVPPANVDLLAQKIPQAETAVIEQAGHFFPFEQPETAVAIVTRFLQENS